MTENPVEDFREPFPVLMGRILVNAVGHVMGVLLLVVGPGPGEGIEASFQRGAGRLEVVPRLEGEKTLVGKPIEETGQFIGLDLPRGSGGADERRGPRKTLPPIFPRPLEGQAGRALVELGLEESLSLEGIFPEHVVAEPMDGIDDGFVEAGHGKADPADALIDGNPLEGT